MGQLFSSAEITEAPLLKPAMEGNIDETKRLVGAFIASDIKSSSSTKNDGTKATVHPVLVEYSNKTDQEGNAAIHGATFAGHLDVVTFLVEMCGASVILKNNLGCSPIWLAAGYDRVEVLRYLIGRVRLNGRDGSEGSNSEDRDNPDDATGLNTSLEREALLAENNTGDTPLLAAASRGNEASCGILLESAREMGISTPDMVRKANRGGDTPLAVAVGAGHSVSLVNLLLDQDSTESDTDMEPTLNRKNGSGLTPLLVACERNHAEIARVLVDRGALPTCDKNGASPLAVAAFCGCYDVAKELLTLPFGIDLLNVPDEAGGCTPLWLAARTGNAKMVRLLLDAGADRTIPNREELTPEQAADKYKKQAVMDLFCEMDGGDAVGVREGDDDQR